MKSFKIFLGVISIFFFFQGCSPKNNEVKIGANLPLTGTVAYYGINAQNGIRLALDSLKLDPTYKNYNFDVIYEDNQGQAKFAITAMTKLINIDKVPVIIGGGSSIETLAAAPLANENKVVLISPISSASSISKAGSYIFRTCPTDNLQAEDLGAWILELGIKNISVVFVNSTWGTSFDSDFENYIKNNGGKIVISESSDPGESNFRPQLSLIKSKNTQALLCIVYAKEGGTLVRQARELGIKQNIFGADPWSQKDFQTGAGQYANGVRYTTPVQYNGEAFKIFRDKFFDKYGKEPDVYASNGFDCMMLVAQAIQKGNRTGEEIQKYFNNVTNFMGATGITHFDENGDVIGKHFGRFIINNDSPELTIK